LVCEGSLKELRGSLQLPDYRGAWNKRRNSTLICLANAIPLASNTLVELFLRILGSFRAGDKKGQVVESARLSVRADNLTDNLADQLFVTDTEDTEDVFFRKIVS
jgi:hypothetical protein